MFSIVLSMFACQSRLSTPAPEVGEVWEFEVGTAEFVEPSTPNITVFANLSEIQVGDLVITEIMHTPQQTPFDSYGEWIELYNAGQVAIDLNGLELSSGNDGGVTFSNSLLVQPGTFVLLGTRSGQNGGLTYDGFYSAGSIRHGINDDLSIGHGGMTFDTVSWTRDLDSVTDGRSFSLDGDDLDSTLNDSIYRWYAGQSVYGDGDYGTPGSGNLPLYMGDELNAGDLVITEIMHNPVQVWDARGEWFEVQNRTDGIVQLYGLSVGSTGEAGFTADSNAWLPVDDFGVFAARAGATVNGGVAVSDGYSFRDFKLGQTDAITLTSSNEVVDEVSYNKFSWGQFNGESLSLSPVATDVIDNDTARYWCAGATPYGDGDLGTPGVVNADCANLDYDGDGYTLEEGDCNDESEFALPVGGVEVCDDIDNDCDGLVDDDDDSVVYTEDDSWYLDIDGDGYGGLYSVPVVQCEAPVGGMDNPYVDNELDCDDLDATTVSDVDCDGVLSEDDCDDLDDSSTIVATDADCDGVLTANDCDDNNAAIGSTNSDADCDGVLTANDCDDNNAAIGATDLDGDGFVACINDCDDTDATLGDIQLDLDCDGVINWQDCDDSDVTIGATDLDGDGFVACVNDCDDNDATIYPNATEIEDDGIDQDCDGEDAHACGLTTCDTNLDLGGGQSMDLVLIPSGTFTMGSPTNEVGRNSDEVQHTVTLTNDYYVMTTEVTQGMFAQLMGYQSYDGNPTSDSGGSFGIGTDYPAYYVTWNMAADFANTVTQRHNTVNGSHLQECYSCSGSGTGVICSVSVDPYQCDGYRMLTEAEWEYAARAGTTAAFWTPNGGGNLPSGYDTTTSTLTDGFDLRLYGHYAATWNNPYGSKEVAQLLPNDYGLYDMSGNLWEWTQDWYGTYFTGSVTNSTGISSATYRVTRGGYWSKSPYALRSAERYGYTPTYRNFDVGFRLALTP